MYSSCLNTRVTHVDWCTLHYTLLMVHRAHLSCQRTELVAAQTSSPLGLAHPDCITFNLRRPLQRRSHHVSTAGRQRCSLPDGQQLRPRLLLERLVLTAPATAAQTQVRRSATRAVYDSPATSCTHSVLARIRLPPLLPRLLCHTLEQTTAAQRQRIRERDHSRHTRISMSS